MNMSVLELVCVALIGDLFQSKYRHHHPSILDACDLMGKLDILSSGWKSSNCSDRAISSKDNSATVQSPCR